MMKRVLLVESDLIVAKLCADDFLHSGYQVEITVDGKMGLSAIPRFKPDVVVLSYFLKDLNAPQVLQRLREKPETKALPVVVLAPANSAADAAAARKAGADKFVLKQHGWDRALRVAVREILEPKPAEPVAEELVEAAEAEPPAAVAQSPASDAAPVLQETKVDWSAASSGQTALVAALKKLSVTLLKSENDVERIQLVGELYRGGQEFLKTCDPSGGGLLTRVPPAFEALLRNLAERPSNIGPSSMRTLFQTVQLLESVFVGGPDKEVAAAPDAYSVLAVDDDPAVRKLVNRALTNLGLKIETAKDPVEALKLADGRRWDLFLLDVNMPKMSGFDLCAKLRAIAAYLKTPVVFLTGCNDIEHRVRFARSKADDFIAKPFLIPELNLKVLGHLVNVAIKHVEETKWESGAFRSFRPAD